MGVVSGLLHFGGAEEADLFSILDMRLHPARRIVGGLWPTLQQPKMHYERAPVPQKEAWVLGVAGRETSVLNDSTRKRLMVQQILTLDPERRENRWATIGQENLSHRSRSAVTQMQTRAGAHADSVCRPFGGAADSPRCLAGAMRKRVQ